MIRDPDFIEQAARIGNRVEPRSVESIVKAIQETIDIDPGIAARAAGFAANAN